MCLYININRYYCFVLIFCNFLIVLSFFDARSNRLYFDNSSNMCYNVSKDALRHAGTATSYKFIANLSTERYKYPGCVPVKIWLLIRHGARTPSGRNLRIMKKALPTIRHHILYNHMMGNSELSEETINLFKEWTMVLPTKPTKLLTESGKKEMIDLAKRFQERFPQLFPDMYSTLHYHFRHTDSIRTTQSAVNYANGLFGAGGSKKLKLPDVIEDIFILKFYKYCRKWKKHVKRNPTHFKEHFKFINGVEANQMTMDLSQRLGLNGTVTFDDTRLMLLGCASEFAWTGNDSPWCHVFSQRDLEVLEYGKDLKQYLRDSYGHEINYKQACPLVKDMMEYLIEDSSWPPVVLSFAHTGTITKFMAALQLYHDHEPLTRKINENRKWNSSKLYPFSTNFGAVLYRCNKNEKKILVLHNERPITLPGCVENELCPISVLQTAYNTTVHNCDFDLICKNKKRSTSKTFAISLLQLLKWLIL